MKTSLSTLIRRRTSRSDFAVLPRPTARYHSAPEWEEPRDTLQSTDGADARAFAKALDTARRLGVRGCLHLLYIQVLERRLMTLLPAYVQARRFTLERRRTRTAAVRLARVRAQRETFVVTGIPPRTRTGCIVNAGEIDRLRGSGPDKEEIVVADIDQDGFLCSHVGPLNNVPTVAPHRFLPRVRFGLTVVDVGGALGVKKHFGDDVVAFLAELEAGRDLHAAGCRVPAILDVDFEELTITFEYIHGRVLREELARQGAILRDRDVAAHPAYRGLTPSQRRAKRMEEGRAVLGRVIGTDTVERLFSEIRKMHEVGYVLHDVKFGNIVLEASSGEPYIIDFDRARRYPQLGRLALRFLRDRDYQKFNDHFGMEKLTHRRALGWTRRPPDSMRRFYAPIYVEGGIRFGNIWTTEAGYGRWRYILRDNLPSVENARVLDLGANNGFYAIQMMRLGAREVIAVETSDQAIAQGGVVKDLFEWADNRRYPLTYVHESMARLPQLDLGAFDVVTALCAIYYLRDDEISILVRHVSSIAETLVLQCNTDRSVRRSDPRTFEKASVAYAVNALRDNGFPFIHVVAPRGYSRPLVIGRR